MEDFDEAIEHEEIASAVKAYLNDRADYWVGSARQRAANEPIVIGLDGAFTAAQLRHIADLIDNHNAKEG